MDSTKWTIDQVIDWLNQNGMSQYSNKFKENEINGQTLNSEWFDDNLQKELIPIIGHRVLFKDALHNLKEVVPCESSSTSELKKTRCEGNACDHCGMCRDWQYDGDVDRDWQRHKDDETCLDIFDKNRWHRANDATCIFYPYTSPTTPTSPNPGLVKPLAPPTGTNGGTRGRRLSDLDYLLTYNNLNHYLCHCPR